MCQRGIKVAEKRYQWAGPGDVNAFFGLMLDNIADLLLTVGLLSAVFQFPVDFSLRYMVPGTAIGVIVGDLLFFVMAISLARRTGRPDVTAMPLGLDTPSTFGMVFFVLGPAFAGASQSMSAEDAARYTWHIGICSIVISGLFKFACAFSSDWIRRVVPRAGLLGSLAAIALVLISFMPFIEVLHYPLVGLVALGMILMTLVARIELPLRVPGALGTLLVAGGAYYGMLAMGWLHAPASEFSASEAMWPSEWLTVFRFEWIEQLPDALQYLPVVLPFALATVIGGIDCTESAAAAGDEFDTNRIIAVESLATMVAGVCGGVIQTTPYIGHPAYKAMGGRAAYTLATALFVGGAGLIGYFGYLYAVIPKAAVFPILIFIGLEITAQSFQATPQRHYPAIGLACVPALASLALIYIDKLAGYVPDGSLSSSLETEILTVRMLANGFIVTSLLWAAGLASLIDRRLRVASAFFAVAAVCSLFGIIHSPLPGGPIFLPTTLDESVREFPLRFCFGYVGVAALLFCWSFFQSNHGNGNNGENETA